MITYSQLNKKGRLGNQLFQIASTIGTAKKINQDFSLPEWEYQHCFKNKLPLMGPQPELALVETVADYQPFDLEQLSDNEEAVIDLNGYFQSEKYFLHAQEEIRRYFEFSDEILEHINKKYSNVLDEYDTTIHVRRGDYLNLKNVYHIPSHLYYFKATSILLVKKAVVFSDDIEWCKTVFKDTDCHFVNEREHDSYEISSTFSAEANAKRFTFEDTVELALMSMFKNNIISNSTFSWWAAWLNNDPAKQVIAPKYWFAQEHIDKIISPEKRNGEYIDDIIPKSWNKA